MVRLIGWGCYLAAAVIGFIVFFGSGPDDLNWLFAIGALTASGLALNSVPPLPSNWQ